MSKFVYEANEIKIGKTQCNLCIHDLGDGKGGCAKYAEKPKEVLESQKKCPFLKMSENAPW